MSLVIIIFFLTIFAGMAFLGAALFIFNKRRHSKTKNVIRFTNGAAAGSHNQIYQSDDTEYYQSVNTTVENSSDDSDVSSSYSSHSSSYESSGTGYDSSSLSDSSSSSDSGSSSSSD